MWLTLAAMRNGIAVLMASLAIILLGRHLARPDAHRPLPQPQLPLAADRHHLQGRERPGHRAERHLPHREGRLRRRQRALRRVDLAPGLLRRHGPVRLGRRHRRGADRGGPAHPGDPQHAADRRPAALHRQVRPLEHPRLHPDRGRRGPRRAGALRPGLQHDRAPDRAAAGGRLGQRGRRQDPPDHDQPRPRPALLQGPGGQRGHARRQRRELPPAVGRRQARHVRLQRVHQQPVLRGRAHGGHRRPPDGHDADPPAGRRAVEDSAETQVSIVRVNGERAVYLRVNKQPGANTIEIVDGVKATMPKLLGVPPGSTSA